MQALKAVQIGQDRANDSREKITESLAKAQQAIAVISEKVSNLDRRMIEAKDSITAQAKKDAEFDGRVTALELKAAAATVHKKNSVSVLQWIVTTGIAVAAVIVALVK